MRGLSEALISLLLVLSFVISVSSCTVRVTDMGTEDSDREGGLTIHEDSFKRLAVSDSISGLDTISSYFGFSKDSLNVSGAAFGGIYDAGDNTYTVRYTDVSASEHSAYIAKLTSSAGIKLAKSYTLGNNSYSLFRIASVGLYISYIKSVNEIRISVEGGYDYPTEIKAEVTGSYSPTLWQLRVDNYTSQANGGMSYVLQLSNGHFIVIDGGYNTFDEAEKLYGHLKAQLPAGEKPIIDAWFISHLHGDHYGAFLAFSTIYDEDDVELRGIYYNFPRVDATAINCVKKAAAVWSEATVYEKLHTGMLLEFTGADIRVVCTHEDIYPNKPIDNNDTATVIRIDIAGQSYMFLADCRDNQSAAMLQNFGDSDVLKCDVVQWSHHGYEGATKALYEKIDADVILFPLNIIGWQENYKTNPQDVFNQWYLKTNLPAGSYMKDNLANGNIKKVIVAGYGEYQTLSLPYTPTGEVLPDHVAYFEEHKDDVPVPSTNTWRWNNSGRAPSTANNTSNLIAKDESEIVMNAGRLPAGTDVTLDGAVSDSAWRYAYPYILNKDYVAGQFDDSADADVYLMYDSDYLYIKEVRRNALSSNQYSTYNIIISDLTMGTRAIDDNHADRVAVGAQVQVRPVGSPTGVGVGEVVYSRTTYYAFISSGRNRQMRMLANFTGVESYTRVIDENCFEMETRIPWSEVGDGVKVPDSDSDSDMLLGFKHYTKFATGRADYHTLSNLGAGYHNEWDNFAPMYLRASVDENAAKSLPDISWYNGTDTEFTISTVGQLYGLAYLVNNCESMSEAVAITDGKTFRLGADIDLNYGWSRSDGSSPLRLWVPIGVFSGTLDGQGYTVDNMVCEPYRNIKTVLDNSVDGWEKDMALIGRTVGDVTVRDLVMTNAYVRSNMNAAALIAYVKEGTRAVVTVDNVYIQADVASDGTANVSGIYGAGIIISRGATSWDNDRVYDEGDVWARISNCVLTGSLTVNGNGGSFGVGPVWSYSDRGVNDSGAKFDATGEISNVLVFDITMTAYRNGTYHSYRIKDIANCGSWKETNSVRVFADGTLKNSAGTVEGYPEGWINADDSNELLMPPAVAEMISRKLWVQRTETDAETGTFSIRVLDVIDTLDWDTLTFKVELSLDGKNFTNISEDIPLVDCVYTSVLAAEERVDAESLGGKYISAMVLSGIPERSSVTFRITPVKQLGDATYESVRTTTFTYIGGALYNG